MRHQLHRHARLAHSAGAQHNQLEFSRHAAQLKVVAIEWFSVIRIALLTSARCDLFSLQRKQITVCSVDWFCRRRRGVCSNGQVGGDWQEAGVQSTGWTAVSDLFEALLADKTSAAQPHRSHSQPEQDQRPPVRSVWQERSARRATSRRTCAPFTTKCERTSAASAVARLATTATSSRTFAWCTRACAVHRASTAAAPSAATATSSRTPIEFIFALSAIRATASSATSSARLPVCSSARHHIARHTPFRFQCAFGCSHHYYSAAHNLGRYHLDEDARDHAQPTSSTRWPRTPTRRRCPTTRASQSPAATATCAFRTRSF